jgi:hypothetical protein
MMCEELSETDYNICMMAVMKCHLLNTYVKSGIQMNPLTEKNFGFAEMTDEEESALINKLHKASELSWLRSQRSNDP